MSTDRMTLKMLRKQAMALKSGRAQVAKVGVLWYVIDARMARPCSSHQEALRAVIA